MMNEINSGQELKSAYVVTDNLDGFGTYSVQSVTYPPPGGKYQLYSLMPIEPGCIDYSHVDRKAKIDYDALGDVFDVIEDSLGRLI